jgi:hypothetical protein
VEPVEPVAPEAPEPLFVGSQVETWPMAVAPWVWS